MTGLNPKYRNFRIDFNESQDYYLDNVCVGGGHTYPQMHMNSTIEMEAPEKRPVLYPVIRKSIC